MHLKDLLGSFVRVGYCILVPDFCLVLHGLRCRKSTIMDQTKPNRYTSALNESGSARHLVYLYVKRYIDTSRNTCIHTCIYSHMQFTRSGSKQVHIDTPTNVTELNWNQVPQPTYECGLDFIWID